ncbi:MAG: glycosyltransferase family 4 protein [Fimbriimonadales bacterium]
MAERPRILEVATSLREWGSIERYVVWLAEGLRARGWDAAVLAAPGTPVASNAAPFSAELRLRGRNDWLAFPAIRKVYRRTRPHIVHLHFSPDYLVPALAARNLGCLVVATRHLALPYNARKAAALQRRIDRWVGVSDAVRRVLVASGLPEDRVHAVLSGIPPVEPMEPREVARGRLGLAENSWAVGFFGRLVEEKGLEHTIRATSPASPWSLQVFGDGPLRRRLEAEATGRPVVFHGKVESVADALSAMDAVVIPSVWEEAFPFSALEAMSLGKPIVASKVGGMPEAVEHRATGLLVPKEDPQALRDALQSLAANPAQAAALGEAGRQRYREMFTLDAMVDRYDSLLRSWVDTEAD